MHSQAPGQDVHPTYSTSRPTAPFSRIACPCSNIFPSLGVHRFFLSVSFAPNYFVSSVLSVPPVLSHPCPFPVTPVSVALMLLGVSCHYCSLSQSGNTQLCSAPSLVPFLAPGRGKLSMKKILRELWNIPLSNFCKLCFSVQSYSS